MSRWTIELAPQDPGFFSRLFAMVSRLTAGDLSCFVLSEQVKDQVQEGFYGVSQQFDGSVGWFIRPVGFILPNSVSSGIPEVPAGSCVTFNRTRSELPVSDCRLPLGSLKSHDFDFEILLR